LKFKECTYKKSLTAKILLGGCQLFCVSKKWGGCSLIEIFVSKDGIEERKKGRVFNLEFLS